MTHGDDISAILAEARGETVEAPQTRAGPIPPANTAETRRLDSLERYVWALEEALQRARPDAPVLRGTWRSGSYAAREMNLQRFNCRGRLWRQSALALRVWMRGAR